MPCFNLSVWQSSLSLNAGIASFDGVDHSQVIHSVQLLIVFHSELLKKACTKNQSPLSCKSVGVPPAQNFRKCCRIIPHASKGEECQERAAYASDRKS